MKIRKPFIWGFIALGSLPICILLYFIFAIIFSFIPVNGKFEETENGIEIYIKSNGVHTDIVVPVKNDLINWENKLNPGDYKKMTNEPQYVSFGWGDKGFYLYTPTWDDLTASTALKAMFWMSSSAMHVSYYDHAPEETKRQKK